MKYLKHFEIEEFESPDRKGSGTFMNTEFLLKLDKAREIAGVPFKITSGYRTKEHNEKVGGVHGSAHTKGLAADISCKTSLMRLLMLKTLIEVGFKRIGISKNFIHVDSDWSKDDAIWLY